MGRQGNGRASRGVIRENVHRLLILVLVVVARPGCGLWAGACSLLLVVTGTAQAASVTLAQVRANGALRCGIGEDLPGFAAKDATGRYRGFNVDFCRAVAAAVLGDPDKVTYTPVSAAGRFPLLLSGRIDLLSHRATWTISREAGIGVRFAGVYFHDGEGVMVPTASGVSRLEDLKGAVICVEKGTTDVANLEDTFRARGLPYVPLIIVGLTETMNAFLAGRCQAFTSDRSVLSALRARVPGGAGRYQLLPETLSREPLAPAVRRGDEEWESIVRWVLNALIAAEDHGLTGSSIRRTLETSTMPALKRLAADGPQVARALGLEPDWYIRAVEAGGNYGEIFERNVGAASPLGLERGLNRLWRDGGLMYSPPFR